jgi:hypothetical protein
MVHARPTPRNLIDKICIYTVQHHFHVLCSAPHPVPESMSFLPDSGLTAA